MPDTSKKVTVSHNLFNTPYINTIPVEKQPPYPGKGELEWRIRSLIRWNAMAMVVRANRHREGIGGHISTYASAATLFEVGFNHFFKGHDFGLNRDLVYFQGHASPGIYARAFLEGRLSDKQLENFRHELSPDGGLSSYPHPHLMPDFWEFPTVSMGLAPLMAIYQARFSRYLEDRGLKPKSSGKIWVFSGDGEMDEPESLGALSMAAREKLDNLIFVVNCNLQRLDGPVRGNGKIIQELESIFHGAGWNVIKVIWGSDWDPMLEKDKEGLLVKRMEEVVDGQYQKYTVENGAYTRKHFFGVDENLAKLAEPLTDEKIRRLRRGGHDPLKIYAAYQQAMENKGVPTVILAKTIKGYGLGEAGEGRNVTHQQKKLNENELREFRARFGIPISDESVAKAPFYKPPEDSPEIQYLIERRKKLGGFLPKRVVKTPFLKTPSKKLFEEFFCGTDKKKVSTTMAFVKILSQLLSDSGLGKYIVPIIPDEARTFGMEGLFKQIGIYSSVGQLYEPVDKSSLLYYREIKNGQILEEGITEAGAISSFIAAGSAYATYGIPTFPFFIFYSMFGLQRIGDLVWGAADMRCKGFLVGATSGRTTLAGEGLQHQDGNSHVTSLSYPNLLSYDPSFAYELAIIIREGIRRMYEKKENIFYYLTVTNENYPMPPMPKGVEEGILKGLYLFQSSQNKKGKPQVHLLGSGAILNEVIHAASILEKEFSLSVSVWSAPSFKELYKEAAHCQRWNMLHPEKKPKKSFVETCLPDEEAVYVAASDYAKPLPLSIANWIPGPYMVLGTDGFGRSDSRECLRDFFEVDYRFVVLAALSLLCQEGKIKKDVVQRTMKKFGINVKKLNPICV